MKNRVLAIMICILCMLVLNGCGNGAEEPPTPEPDEKKVTKQSLSSVIGRDCLFEPLNLEAIREIDLGCYSPKVRSSVIQNAMNGKVLINLEQQNPDYTHPSIHTLVAYCVESQTYETIYEFPDDAFVLADIAFEDGHYYAIIFDQVNQELEDLTQYLVVRFVRDSYEVVDIGEALGPFTVPLFHQLGGKIYYLMQEKLEGCFYLKELHEGTAHLIEEINPKGVGEEKLNPASFFLTSELSYAYLTHSIDADGNLGTKHLTLKGKEPTPVPSDTRILALTQDAILLGNDESKTLEVIEVVGMKVTAQYGTGGKVMHAHRPLNGFHGALLDSVNTWQPVVLELTWEGIQLRHVEEIQYTALAHAYIFDLGSGQWGLQVLGDESDCFYITKPRFKK